MEKILYFLLQFVLVNPDRMYGKIDSVQEMGHLVRQSSLMCRVFANGPGDWGSIPG